MEREVELKVAEAELEVTMLRHKGFFHPDEQKATSVTVYGAGSVGSHVTYELAKLGVKNLVIVDFDVVELHNIGNQFYKMSDVGKKKGVALKQNIIEFTGREIEDKDKMITGTGDNLDISIGSVHILTFDNIDARRFVYNQLKGFPVTLIDARAGGEGWEVYEIDCSNELECQEFEKTFDGEFSPALCGFQTVIYNVTNLASEVCNQFKKLNADIPRPRIIRREMKTYKYLASQAR